MLWKGFQFSVQNRENLQGEDFWEVKGYLEDIFWKSSPWQIPRKNIKKCGKKTPLRGSSRAWCSRFITWCSLTEVTSSKFKKMKNSSATKCLLLIFDLLSWCKVYIRSDSCHLAADLLPQMSVVMFTFTSFFNIAPQWLNT